MKAILLIPLIAVLACAQDADQLVLRGVVFEIGPNTPLAGAQVTVYQFGADRARTVFDNIVTDSSGAFEFKPTLPGDYYVEAAKPDYFAANNPAAVSPAPSTTGALVKLNKDHPSEELRLALLRFGALRGKVEDDDGKPLSRLSIELIPEAVVAAPALSLSAVRVPHSTPSASDGSFFAKGLAPGNYVVRVSARPATMKRPQTDFSEDEENAIDQEFATSYWPGVAERASAAAATVNPGGDLDLGTLRIHKESRYRIHFVVHGCEPGDRLSLLWSQDGALQEGISLAEFARGELPGLVYKDLPCHDLLVSGLPAGSYQFVATTPHGAALTALTITDRNATAALSLIANGDVLGRVITVSGDPPPQQQPALQGRTRILPDVKGNFTMTNVQCLPGPLRLMRLDEAYYIKEIRVDGVAVPGGDVMLCAGSRLEIVLDDRMAKLAVSVTAGNNPVNDAMIFVQKWPASPLDQPAPTPGKSAALQLTKLAPGDYRVLALRQVVLADGEDLRAMLTQLWDRATKITLDPGDAKSISVDLIDPFL